MCLFGGCSKNDLYRWAWVCLCGTKWNKGQHHDRWMSFRGLLVLDKCVWVTVLEQSRVKKKFWVAPEHVVYSSCPYGTVRPCLQNSLCQGTNWKCQFHFALLHVLSPSSHHQPLSSCVNELGPLIRRPVSDCCLLSPQSSMLSCFPSSFPFTFPLITCPCYFLLPPLSPHLLFSFPNSIMPIQL